jgi:ADP-ribose pyrophosphatase YjhB (NUDIX family)
VSADQHDQPLHSVSVAGVIIDDAEENVLLIRRRDNGHWEPPGGVLELNETIEDGLRREIREETGLDITIDRLTGVYKNLSRGIVALVYRCHAQSEPSKSTPEAVDVRWQALTAIDDLMAPVYAIRVHDAQAEGVETRAHDGLRLVQDHLVR